MSKENDPLRYAKLFATMKHEGQKYGVLPYTHHLQDVERVLRDFGETDIDMLTAAWLHDVVEDTPTKLKEIYEVFNERVAELVGGVTNEPGENRKHRQALTYPKTRSTPGAVKLKLADRLANVSNGGRLLDMYKKEYDDFKRNLYTPGVEEEMWAHLDKIMKG